MREKLIEVRNMFVDACFPSYFSGGSALVHEPIDNKTMLRLGKHTPMSLIHVFKVLAATPDVRIGQRVAFENDLSVAWLTTATGEWLPDTKGWDVTDHSCSGLGHRIERGVVIGIGDTERSHHVVFDSMIQRYDAPDVGTLYAPLELDTKGFEAFKRWLVSRDRSECPPDRFVDAALRMRSESRIPRFEISTAFAWFVMSYFVYDTCPRTFLIMLDSGELCAPQVYFFSPAW